MQGVRTLSEADVAGKRVLVHTDFDVPLADGRVADDHRIRTALPTLNYLLEHGAQHIIVISKLGRPGGKVVEELRMKPVVEELQTLIDCTRIEVLENLRFDPREEENDEELAKELASMADLFINEAFADSHREHASIVGIPKFLPSYIGLHFEDELKHLSRALTPPMDSVAIVGGAKFETKEPLLSKLSKTYGKVLLGGVLANDLLKSRGMPVGVSVTSQAPVPTDIAEEVKIEVPVDLIVANATTSRPANTGDVRRDERIVDIGRKTAEQWAVLIEQAPFVLWNGPTGVYEEGFTSGTDALAVAIAKSQARVVVGGGDTIAALSKTQFDTERVFISVAGGAMLEYLTAGTLPGIEALKQSN